MACTGPSLHQTTIIIVVIIQFHVFSEAKVIHIFVIIEDMNNEISFLTSVTPILILTYIPITNIKEPIIANTLIQY